MMNDERMDCRAGTTLVVLNLLHFTITAILPIYNKEFFKIAPYPVFDTLLQMFVSIPIAFICAWINSGLTLDFLWLKIPKEVVCHLIYSSFSYGFMLAIGNLGLHVSNIDFAILFRLSGLVWQGVFAFFFLGEKLSLLNLVCMLFVISGTIVMSVNFGSSSKTPPLAQVAIQMLTILFTSLSSISAKKVMNKSKELGSNLHLLTIHFYRFLIATIPATVISLFTEKEPWSHFGDMMTLKILGFVALGVFLTQLFQLIGLKLQQMTTVITLAVLSQLKFLPTLIMSHFLYHETEWTSRQIFGSILLIGGAIAYSLTRVLCPPRPEAECSSEEGQENQEIIIEIDHSEEEDINFKDKKPIEI